MICTCTSLNLFLKVAEIEPEHLKASGVETSLLEKACVVIDVDFAKD